MNSLPLGFLYLIGLGWLLAEVCVSASAGNWTPLWLFLAFFVAVFATVGCLPLKDKSVNRAGAVSALVIGLWIVLYGLGSFDSSIPGAFARIVGGLAVAAMGALGFLAEKEENHAHH